MIPTSDYERRLPHIHPDGAHLFVTWRLHGSEPRPEPDIIYATPGHRFAAMDRNLVHARGPQWLGDSQIARRIGEIIHLGASEKRLYELHAWAIMPNHVHLFLLPRVPLPRITQWLKGRTAREANILLERTGQPFWQDESYDRWVRNEKEFARVVSYIENNPVSAGFVAKPEDWPWSSASWAG
jgi:putative transposase